MSTAAAMSHAREDRFIAPLASAAAGDAERVGPKAANLAALARAGLPTPGGFCLTADAYRDQIAALGLTETLARYAAAEMREQRRLSVEIRLALYEQPIAPKILSALLDAWRAARAGGAKPFAVRSSALIEDKKGANFAGQFESFLGITDEAAFITAVRACWAALWTTNARRYMENHGMSPGDTAMAVLIQPLIEARASGGGLSENAEGQMVLSATWGLGSAIAQGEVVPDRIVLAFCAVTSPAARTTATPAATAPAPCARRCRANWWRSRASMSARRSRWDACCARSKSCSACPSRSNGRSTRQASSCCRRARFTWSRPWYPTPSGCSIPDCAAIPPASAGAPAAPW
jgi:Pyruvate phosphate dikinase, AMP/ATP-binding domain